jgi:hypothetical protein
LTPSPPPRRRRFDVCFFDDCFAPLFFAAAFAERAAAGLVDAALRCRRRRLRAGEPIDYIRFDFVLAHVNVGVVFVVVVVFICSRRRRLRLRRRCYRRIARQRMSWWSPGWSAVCQNGENERKESMKRLVNCLLVE